MFNASSIAISKRTLIAEARRVSNTAARWGQRTLPRRVAGRARCPQRAASGVACPNPRFALRSSSGCGGKPAGRNEQNRMTASLSDCAARVRKFMAQAMAEADFSSAGSTSDDQRIFGELALALFTLQFTHNEVYRKFCEFRGVTPHRIIHWSDIPALPASAFKEVNITSLSVEERKVVFQSSGTTTVARSRHFHSAQSLALYEASLLSWFSPHLTPDAEQPLAILSLTPSPEAAPTSSLVHMFETIRAAQSPPESLFAGAVEADGSWTLNFAGAVEFLHKATNQFQQLLLLGTTFNFVHLLDYSLEHHLTFALPPGSRILETGGYKGRSRVISKPELHELMTQRLGVQSSHIITEYGMSELSSQAYDGVVARSRSSRLFRFPPWARVQIISPETGQAVAKGQTGLIRVFDLANVWSVMAIQTEDLGIEHGRGFELIGRADVVAPRGCSLMASDR